MFLSPARKPLLRNAPRRAQPSAGRLAGWLAVAKLKTHGGQLAPERSNTISLVGGRRAPRLAGCFVCSTVARPVVCSRLLPFRIQLGESTQPNKWSASNFGALGEAMPLRVDRQASGSLGASPRLDCFQHANLERLARSPVSLAGRRLVERSRGLEMGKQTSSPGCTCSSWQVASQPTG